MGASLLQSNKAQVASGATTLNIAFLSAVTPGSLLVCYAGSTATTRTFTASDGVNGAWNNDQAGNGGQGSGAILSFPNTASGTPTVTLTMSGAGGQMDAMIEEWSGIQTVTPFDKGATLQTTATTSAATGTTATLSQGNELCLAMMHLTNAGGAGFAVTTAGWNASPVSPTTNGFSAAANIVQAATTAVSANFSWTNTTGARGIIATYKTVQLGQLAPFYSRKYILFNT